MLLRYVRRAGVAAVFGTLLLVQQASLHAQKRGPAATGGSLALERAGGKPAGATTTAPERYRGALRELGLDYQGLTAEYSKSQRAARPQSFRSIAVAHILARELSPSDEQAGAGQIIDELEAGRSLTASVARAFHLSSAEARRHVRAAESRFARAERAAAGGGL